MTSIPISEDELTEILIYKLARKRGSLSIDMNHVDVCREVEPQARSLARKMIAAEQMYEALKCGAEALGLAQAQLGGEAMCKRGPLVPFMRAALAAAEGRNA